ncbi:MAG: hypothetical protein CR968_03505 [Flavobacteriia bacterium]|nr:MAG: hypothetical protein CR968_03505 [Flavobacteriia bacterium]
MKAPTNSYETSNFSMTDTKSLLRKALSYWKWFLASLIVAFLLALYVNVSSLRVYSLKSLITVKEEQSPVFTTDFNWSGVSDRVETVKAILRSRSHNEKVVSKGQFYIDYLKQGDYRLDDVYGQVPFQLGFNNDFFQLTNTLIKLTFLDENTVNISYEVPEKKVDLYNYATLTSKNYVLSSETFNRDFSLDKLIETDVLSLQLTFNGTPDPNESYFIRFNDFNSTVSKYQEIKVESQKNGTSLISLTLDGPNKNKLVNYLNSTVQVLSEDQVRSKIEYAVKTKAYIDTLFKAMSSDLKNIEKDLGNFKSQQKIYNLSTEGSAIFEDMVSLDANNKQLQDRLEYYNRLENYIKSSTSVSEKSIPIPSVVDIADPNINQSVGVLIAKYKTKENLLQTVTEDYPAVKQLNRDIEVERNSLLENLANLKAETKVQINKHRKRLGGSQSQLRKLPEKEQKLLNYQRRYTVAEQNYNYLKQKSYEAGTVIASNVSDITVIDNAKDTDQKPYKPQTKFNLMIGLLLALIIPFIVILIKEQFNTKINTVEEVENYYKIPIISVIGSLSGNSNFVLYDNPKSVNSESYRALRSNIRFLLDRHQLSHVILLTSSISGEGKTVTALNLAGVFALSNKKTIIVGADLRKPKLHKEFGMTNDIGLVDYLIGANHLDEVVKHTEYKNLDVLLSGSIPPNPSELLLSQSTAELMEHLKERYDIIIIDAPPIGIVSDAQELFKFSDIVLYIIRQGYTDKGLLRIIERKYERKEVEKINYILNDFKFNKRNGYGYGYDYYTKSYALEEQTSWFQKMKQKLNF